MGLAYQVSGHLAEAVAELQRAQALSGGSTLVTATLAGALAAAGKEHEANAILAELEEVALRRYVPQSAVAAVYVAKGDLNEALTRLEKAYVERCIWLPYALTAEPRFDGLRNEARFRNLARRVAAGGN
jgi:Flp pilus assembly protein TadD